ncbi:hypothetical protein CWATWH0401_2542 [Crocosphaera watsonii WH 0401]|uniref:Uncharacterized protein n=1 Tax=Crocosphaera watsonii WH 0401 TaxID=555881 RepID=T2J8I3_CROWT|nr:hypothetical protein CWATWH0401_2542 [Crocosphaera watsonii WH 0401]
MKPYQERLVVSYCGSNFGQPITKAVTPKQNPKSRIYVIIHYCPQFSFPCSLKKLYCVPYN